MYCRNKSSFNKQQCFCAKSIEPSLELETKTRCQKQKQDVVAGPLALLAYQHSNQHSSKKKRSKAKTKTRCQKQKQDVVAGPLALLAYQHSGIVVCYN